MMIEFRPYDLMIKRVMDKRSNMEVEVVQIKGSVAFDPDFIEEMKLKGVKTYEEREAEKEEEIPNEG